MSLDGLDINTLTNVDLGGELYIHEYSEDNQSKYKINLYFSEEFDDFTQHLTKLGVWI